MEPKVQIPPELVGTVAQYVADGNPAFRSKTLTSCMLVSKTFAKEFRPFVFEVLHINDYERPLQVLGHIILCKDLLLQRPEYAPMVKKVVIRMSETLIMQSTRMILTLGQLLGHLSSVCSVVFGGAPPALIFDFHCLLYGVMEAFNKALSRLCNLPTIRTISFEGYFTIPSIAFTRAPHSEQVTLQDASFYNSPYESNFDPSYLADGFHLILRGRVHIPDDAASLLSRVKKLSLYVETLLCNVYKKVARLPLLSGYLRTLDITIRDVDLGQENFMLNLSEGKTLIHIHYTFTSTKYECLKSQETNAQILVNIICSLPPLSAVETITITLRGIISAEDLREDAVQNAWKELDSVLSNPRRFPALQRVDLDVVYDISKTKAADEILALKAVANSMLGSLSDKVLTVSLCALEVEEEGAGGRGMSQLVEYRIRSFMSSPYGS